MLVPLTRALALLAALTFAGGAHAQVYNPPTLSGLGGMATNASNATAAALGNIVSAATSPQSWTAAQRGTPVTITISTLTFTPNFDAGNNFALTLAHSAANVLANPSTTPVAGQSGVFVITQSGTGSDAIGTWGSQYVTAGGTAGITLSTGAGVSDYLPYYVSDATHIVLGAVVAGPTH